MKVLFVGADYNNSRDGVIVNGIYSLIDFLDIKINSYYHILDDNNLESENIIEEKDYDCIVVCGTPWLWDQFYKSIKYKNMINIIKGQKNAKVMFFGVGSCIGLDHINSEICEDEEHQEGIRNLFGNTTVVARDNLFFNKLKKSGVESYLLPCPSYFCYLNEEFLIAKERNVLVWCDPKKSISSCDWQDEVKLQEYYDLFLNFYKQYAPLVCCAMEEEIQSAVEIGLPEPLVLNSWRETQDIMKRANYVLSARVHCAVPAFVLNKPTSIIALDSRSKVLSDYGCHVHDKNNSFRVDLGSLNLGVYLDQYKSVLNNFFKIS